MLTTRCPNCQGRARVLRMAPTAHWVACQDCDGSGRVEPYEDDPTVLCGACCGSGEGYSGGRCFTCRGRGEVPAVADEYTVDSVEEWLAQIEDETNDQQKEMTT